ARPAPPAAPFRAGAPPAAALPPLAPLSQRERGKTPPRNRPWRRASVPAVSAFPPPPPPGEGGRGGEGLRREIASIYVALGSGDSRSPPPPSPSRRRPHRRRLQELRGEPSPRRGLRAAHRGPHWPHGGAPARPG